MNKFLLSILLILSSLPCFSQKVTVESPNQKIKIELLNRQNSDAGEWFMKVKYISNDEICEAIPDITLGLSRSDQDFYKELKFLKTGKPVLISEQYTALHGKRSQCSNSANETVVYFENPDKSKLNLIIRAYNDGVVFRYEFPGKDGTFIIKDEYTSYDIPSDTKRWMEKWNPANEGLYSAMNDDNTQQGWCYPALFNASGNKLDHFDTLQIE